MRRIMALLAHHRWWLVFGILALLVTAALTMLIPALMRTAVDGIATGRGDAERTLVRHTVFAIAGLALAGAVVRTLSRALIFNVGREVEFELRNQLFDHLLRLPAAFYQVSPTGDLMSRAVNDIGAVRMMLGPGLLNLVNTPVYYLWALGFMLAIDPVLTAASLAPYPLGLLAIKGASRRLMEGQLRVQVGLADLSTAVQENVAGIHVVKAYAMEEAQVRRFAARNEDFQRVSLELARTRGLIAPVARVVSAFGILVVLWLGGARVVAGVLTLGDLVAFMGYLHLLAWPTMALGWMLSIVQRGRAAMGRLDEIFAIEPVLGDPVDAGPSLALPSAVRGEIEFRGVSFAYPDAPERPILSDIDLRIPAGATVALVGRAGSGKSTLLSLVPRLFDPSAGEVRIDGRPLRDWPLEALRRAVAVVPQDPFLFSSSIARNIAFARPGLVDGADGSGRDGAAAANGEEGTSRAGGRPHAAGSPGSAAANGAPAGLVEIRAAAGWAAVADDIERFPRGYQTMVGERGITLSGGQKQRVTLARALVADAPILILDDALSSVDTHTETAILSALEERRRGRTCIVVAHRLSTVANADLILVFDEGRIVERGDHAGLVARRGIYAELFRRERLEAEIEEA